jgi:hypothetical protein
MGREAVNEPATVTYLDGGRLGASPARCSKRDISTGVQGRCDSRQLMVQRGSAGVYQHHTECQKLYATSKSTPDLDAAANLAGAEVLRRMVEAAILTALRSEPDQSTGEMSSTGLYAQHRHCARCSAGAAGAEHCEQLAAFVVISLTQLRGVQGLRPCI